MTQPDPVTTEATFPARYDGQCPSCDLPVSEGQIIHRLSSGAFVHAECQP